MNDSNKSKIPSIAICNIGPAETIKDIAGVGVENITEAKLRYSFWTFQTCPRNVGDQKKEHR